MQAITPACLDIEIARRTELKMQQVPNGVISVINRMLLDKAEQQKNFRRGSVLHVLDGPEIEKVYVQTYGGAWKREYDWFVEHFERAGWIVFKENRTDVVSGDPYITYTFTIPEN